ncbi:protein LRATD1 [Pygocentrus nattereri]|uniref:protein LRATD1 n=1 Tax=Pygocentrus nattereri TaxID=42514 RepID=UPI000814B024|nr:protein LRATD1 [Pygocentrus nattereri]XP_017577397.1 protein LRATD1 [Pygocentrus nattereri]
MGNQLDRITHLNYSELPTGDPSGVEKDELRVGVAYFFSDDEEEPDDRSPSDSFRDDSPRHGGGGVGSGCGSGDGGGGGVDGDGIGIGEDGGTPPLDELEYSAFCCHECIFSKLRASEDLRVHSPAALLSMCKPGDVLELVARAQPPHWAVFAGGDRVVHLHKGEIRADSLLDVSGGRPGRIVNERYRYRPLPAELVVRNAAGHVGLRGGEVCWGDSESFAAWCRFGKREFKAGGEAHSAEQRYFLKVHAAHSTVRTLVFRSLEDMIRERRRVDASGLLHELRR